MIEEQPKLLPTARLSITKSAKELGVSRTTIYRMIETTSCRIKYRKSNNRPYLTGSQIIKLWQETH